MMRRTFFLLAATAFAIIAHAQTPAPVPDTLLRNSNAVVRLCSLEFNYQSPTSATMKVITETTILNPTGVSEGSFGCYVDPDISLKSFSGTILDARGVVLRKLKRSELKYTEYSSMLAQDGAYYYMDIYAPSYPYTVRTESEQTFKNGILGFPSFLPLNSPGISLEKGIYTLSVPQGMEFGFKGLNIGEPVKTTAAGRDTYVWTAENIPALKSEPAMPPAIELLPRVYTAPYDFQYQRTQGSMRDWTSFGKWMCSLLEGRDILPDALKEEVHKRTDHLSTPREKVRALYNYLGETTRYVSIQLGIGGQQPMPASEVYKTKFGDCKALSNYMHAMLAECGIASEYAIINSKRRFMFPDYVSPDQADHAILRVPLDDGDLWLECTNPEVPFGYVHQRIAGHNAIVFRNGTGERVTLPQYADSLNRQINKIEITIAENGSASGRITERYEVAQYEPIMPFPKLDAGKRTDFLSNRLKIPLAQISGMTFTENKEAHPSMEIVYDISSPKYCNITGNRWFVPISPHKDLSTYKDKERLHDIYYEHGYFDTTTVTLDIPENLQLEARPKSCSIETPFGSYGLQIRTEKGRITIEMSTIIRAGTYPRSMFEQYREFITERAKSFNSYIVLKKV